MILVDVTEQASNRATSRLVDLRKYITPATLVEAVPLEFADVAFPGKQGKQAVMVGVEIKSVPDVLQCIDTGRFAGHQLPGLRESYHHSWLVVEGKWRASEHGVLQLMRWDRAAQRYRWGDAQFGRKDRSWMYSELQHWLTTMDVCGGIRIARTDDRDETARWIAALYWWWQKDWQQHKSLRVIPAPREPKIGRLNDVAKAAAMLPGIGYDKARKVGDRFASIEEMVLADVDEWASIKGIGNKGAKTIVDAIKRRRKIHA